MITAAGIQYELLEAEWQMMEEANTEHRNSQVQTRQITTPSQWERALEKYLDREFVRWLLQGIWARFRIGYDRSNRCTPFK